MYLFTEAAKRSYYQFGIKSMYLETLERKIFFVLVIIFTQFNPEIDLESSTIRK